MTEFKNGKYINPSIQRVAVNWDRKYLPLFEQVKKTWNIPIRNYYKKIMGVNLQDEETSKRQEIRINLKPISDLRIIRKLEEVFGDLDFEEFQKLKAFLNASENVLEYFVTAQEHHKSLIELIDFTKNKLNKFDLDNFNKTLIELLYDGNPDVFGRYFGSHFSNKGEIDLYIIPCVLFCEANNLDLSTFVTMVLAHELAHGYNHLGIDKDNYHWENFWDTDDYLAEGLAQYYTLEFLEKHLLKIPKGIEVFEFLLSHQSAPYKSFETWEASPEKIYSAFIEARRNMIFKNDDFLTLLAGAKKRIKGDRKTITDNIQDIFHGQN